MLPGGMGGMEVVLIALLALVVVGPKDLPILMRRLARWVNHVRGMAAEFRSSFDEMARQSELDELRREVEALRRGDPLEPIRNHLDPGVDEINAAVRPDAAADPYLPNFEPEGVAPVEPYLPHLEPAPEPAQPDLAPPPAASSPDRVVPEPAQTQLLPEKPARPRARRKAPAAAAAAVETASVAIHEGEA